MKLPFVSRSAYEAQCRATDAALETLIAIKSTVARISQNTDTAVNAISDLHELSIHEEDSGNG